MANYTESSMSVILPTTKVDDFIKLFISKGGDDERLTFSRTYLINMLVDVQNKDLTLLRIDFECAWSIYSCLLEDNAEHPNLRDVVKDFDVQKMVIYSKETGIGFEESVIYNKDEDEELQYESRDLYYDPLMLYLRKEES